MTDDADHAIVGTELAEHVDGELAGFLVERAKPLVHEHGIDVHATRLGHDDV